MPQQPIYLTASPHLGDYSANQYDLDYTLSGSYPAAIFAIGICHHCGHKFSIAPTIDRYRLTLTPTGTIMVPIIAGYAIMSVDPKNIWPPLATVTGAAPVCVTPDCKGAGQELAIVSLGSVITGEGEWIEVSKGDEG